MQNWQEQECPFCEAVARVMRCFMTLPPIRWYAERDAEIENEKLRREVEELRQASETDLQPGTIEYERHRLTRAQADAQELKNARDSAEVGKPHSVLSCCRGSQVKLPVFSTGSCRCSGVFRTGKPTDFLKRDITRQRSRAGN
ncbi:terminase small subunit [Escherichia coli]|nr:terminase small subunit [Escherichia coli]